MLPARYQEMLFGEPDPGVAYRRCLEEFEREGGAPSVEWTDTVVYATEVRYVLDILEHGRPKQWWNFADRVGNWETRLWRLLDPLGHLRLAFVGSGPYPVTALLIQERYPTARITCVDSNVVAYLLSRALFAHLGLDIEVLYEEAMNVDYAPFNAVIVAAMVGGRLQLTERILQSSNALCVVRGSVPLEHERLVQTEKAFADDGSFGGQA